MGDDRNPHCGALVTGAPAGIGACFARQPAGAMRPVPEVMRYHLGRPLNPFRND